MKKTLYFPYGVKEIAHLSQTDPILARWIEETGPVKRPIYPDLFECIVYGIVGQLISVASARAIWNRLVLLLREVTPGNVLAQTESAIQSVGLTKRKAHFIYQISELFDRGQISPHDLPFRDREAIDFLCSLPGIGKWTAQIVLLHSECRPNILPWEDVALRRGMATLCSLAHLTLEQFEAYRASYSPYNSVAAIYLWYYSGVLSSAR